MMVDETEERVYCDVQMSLEVGLELLQLISDLHRSGAHPNLDAVFQEIQSELKGSIEFVAKGNTLPGQRKRSSH
jgi:hypothetical protein